MQLRASIYVKDTTLQGIRLCMMHSSIMTEWGKLYMKAVCNQDAWRWSFPRCFLLDLVYQVLCDGSDGSRLYRIWPWTCRSAQLGLSVTCTSEKSFGIFFCMSWWDVIHISDIMRVARERQSLSLSFLQINLHNQQDGPTWMIQNLYTIMSGYRYDIHVRLQIWDSQTEMIFMNIVSYVSWSRYLQWQHSRHSPAIQPQKSCNRCNVREFKVWALAKKWSWWFFSVAF